MIRFVNLGKQLGVDEDWPMEFAFYNTVIDRFVEYSGSQVWESWELFEKDYVVGSAYPLDRFRRLCPDWAFVQKTEEKNEPKA